MIRKSFVGGIILLFLFSNVISIPISISIEYHSSSDNYDLIIISPQEFSDNLIPLMNHKNSLGVSTDLKTVEDIYQEFDGRDEAEQIKYFIKYAIENFDIKYVLLVGGRAPSIFEEKWFIPVRYSHIEFNWTLPEWRYLSDLYFADIYDKNGNFSSWDTNNNDIFGEWFEDMPSTDVIDMYPDVFVGRIPCRNKYEVSIMVDKIISYETNVYSDAWFKKMVVVAGDTYTDNDYFEGEVASEDAIEFMPDFSHIRLFTSDGSFSSPIDVIRAINDGCGFLFLSGHGSPYSWGTHPPYDNNKLIRGLNIPHMFFLKNGEKLPICLVGGCHNSMFNISLFHQSWTFRIPTPECWSWWLTRKVDGGAIASIGCTGLGYGKEDKHNPELGGGGDYLNVLFFKEYGRTALTRDNSLLN